jgi:hypothetical protein
MLIVYYLSQLDCVKRFFLFATFFVKWSNKVNIRAIKSSISAIWDKAKILK